MKRRLKSIAALPTLVTLGNTFCGFLAVTYVLEALYSLDEQVPESRALFYDYLIKAVWAMLIAMVFDFLDGKVARLTGSESLFGVQIDSLSDVLSFGLVPALLFKTMAEFEFAMSPKSALVLACFYLFGAVLRLARFNVEADLEDDDHRIFKGLPSPAAAAGVGAIVFLYASRALGENADDHIQYIVKNEALLPAVEAVFPWIVCLLGVLMWTKLPYVHVANVLLTEKRHPWHLLVILATIGVVAWKPPFAIAVLMMAYALSGPALYVWDLCTGRPTVEGESLL